MFRLKMIDTQAIHSKRVKCELKLSEKPVIGMKFQEKCIHSMEKCIHRVFLKGTEDSWIHEE
jgi:hypothetical protein